MKRVGGIFNYAKLYGIEMMLNIDLTETVAGELTPTAYAIRHLLNADVKLALGLAELLDNSFGERRGNANKVVIFWNRKTRYFHIIDDGEGMKNVQLLFHLGRGEGLHPNTKDIGIMGVGATEALVAMARGEITVLTLYNGQRSRGAANWYASFKREQYPIVIPTILNSFAKNSYLELSGQGTEVIFRLHRDKYPIFQVPALIHELERLYQFTLRDGKQIEWIDAVTSRSIELKAPPYKFSDKVVLDLPPENGLPAITGEIGMISDLLISQSNVAVAYENCRVITTTTECFKGYNANGIAGYLKLGDGCQEYLNAEKTAITNRTFWQTCMDRVRVVIEPFLKKHDEEATRIELEGINFCLEGILGNESAVEKELRLIKTIPASNGNVNVGRNGGGGSQGGQRSTKIGNKRKMAVVNHVANGNSQTVLDGNGNKLERGNGRSPGLRVIPEPARLLENAICRADPQGDTMTVSFQKEYALKYGLGRKENRTWFISEVLEAVAQSLIQPAQETLFKIVFPHKNIREKIESISSLQQRASFVKFLLLDRVKNPASLEETQEPISVTSEEVTGLD